MRSVLALLTASLVLHTEAQEMWRSLLLADPEMTNGYFLLDNAKCTRSAVASVEVDLVLHELRMNGTYGTSTFQTINIVLPELYGHLDFDLLPAMEPGDVASYRVRARNANGDIITAFDRTDGSLPRTEICRTTCNSNSYSWALVALEHPDLGNTIIKFREGTIGGAYPCFYVSGADMWGAGGFAQQYSPSDFCLNGDDWTELLPLDQLEIIPGINVAGKANYLGYLYGPEVTQPNGFAIRKGLGPWCGLYAQTEPLLGNDYCDEVSPGVLQAHFNADAHVQQAIANLTDQPGPVNCQAALLSGGGPGWNEWGTGGVGQCVAFSYTEEDSDGDGIVDIGNWIAETIDCPPIPPIYAEDLSAVSAIQINHWYTASPHRVLDIQMPDESDPKLLPVPRTQLDPGLYEYVVIFDNGLVWRKFRSYDHTMVISATFASFTDVVVYPVPVDRPTFSVDFETLAPLNVTVTVINNQGTVFYQRSDTFPLAGRNKHVVNMASPWPSGIYHVIIGYDDGSSESIGITIQ